MTTIEPHPLAELIPPMSDVDYAGLLAGIRENGQREPVVLLDGQVLDGRTRCRACQELNLAPVTREFGSRATDGRDPVAFVIDMNLRRRQMTEAEKVKAAVRLVELWGDLRRRTPSNDGVRNPRGATAEAASRCGVSESKVARALMVRREAPDLYERMGELTVNTACRQARERRRTAPPEPAPDKPRRAPTIPASERAAEQRRAVQLLVKANGAALAANVETVNVSAAIQAIKFREDLIGLATNVGWSVRYLQRIERELRDRLEPAELHRVDSAFAQSSQPKGGPLRVIRGEAS
jgi:hypothetical protein